MNAKDDPIIGSRAIDYDIFKNNPNAVLGTTNRGGHLGYRESAFSTELWYMKPVLDFLDAYRDDTALDRKMK